MLKVMMVDDHSLFREGLAHLLTGIDKNIEMLHATNCEEALILLDENPDLDLSLDLMLLDLAMPGVDGATGLAYFKRRLKTVPVVIVSATENYGQIMQLLEEGVQGFIPKSFTGDMMLAALKHILAGGIYVPYQLVKHSRTQNDTLSERQRQVLTLLADGLPNKMIARKLNISENTVRAHVAGILKALGVRNRTEAAKMTRIHCN